MYQQQQEIAGELRRIRSLVAAQEAQTVRYAAAVERVDEALRELGDAETYMWAMKLTGKLWGWSGLGSVVAVQGRTLFQLRT